MVTKAMQKRRTNLGQEHPATIASMELLAKIYHLMGKKDKV